jgi:hypothetical protein
LIHSASSLSHSSSFPWEARTFVVFSCLPSEGADFTWTLQKWREIHITKLFSERKLHINHERRQRCRKKTKSEVCIFMHGWPFFLFDSIFVAYMWIMICMELSWLYSILTTMLVIMTIIASLLRFLLLFGLCLWITIDRCCHAALSLESSLSPWLWGRETFRYACTSFTSIFFINNITHVSWIEFGCFSRISSDLVNQRRVHLVFYFWLFHERIFFFRILE